MKHPLNQFFDKIYCINLIERPDRRKRVEERFNKLGIEVEFFTTVKFGFAQHFVGKKEHVKFKHANAFGCTSSHYSLIKLAKFKGYKNVLIFEDDCIFRNDFNDIIDEYLSYIPKEWDMVYFYNTVGVWTEHHKWIVPDKMFTSHTCYATNAVAVNFSFYDTIIDFIDNNLEVIDVCYRKLQDMKKYNIFTFSPNLTGQEEGFSDLTEVTRGYWRSINFKGLTKKDFF